MEPVFNDFDEVKESELGKEFYAKYDELVK